MVLNESTEKAMERLLTSNRSGELFWVEEKKEFVVRSYRRGVTLAYLSRLEWGDLMDLVGVTSRMLEGMEGGSGECQILSRRNTDLDVLELVVLHPMAEKWEGEMLGEN